MYDSHDWAGRKEGQPFFMQVQLHGGKLQGASEVHYTRFDTQVSKLFPKPLTPAASSCLLITLAIQYSLRIGPLIWIQFG